MHIRARCATTGVQRDITTRRGATPACGSSICRGRVLPSLVAPFLRRSPYFLLRAPRVDGPHSLRGAAPPERHPPASPPHDRGAAPPPNTPAPAAGVSPPKPCFPVVVQPSGQQFSSVQAMSTPAGLLVLRPALLLHPGEGQAPADVLLPLARHPAGGRHLRQRARQPVCGREQSVRRLLLLRRVDGRRLRVRLPVPRAGDRVRRSGGPADGQGPVRRRPDAVLRLQRRRAGGDGAPGQRGVRPAGRHRARAARQRAVGRRAAVRPVPDGVAAGRDADDGVLPERGGGHPGRLRGGLRGGRLQVPLWPVPHAFCCDAVLCVGEPAGPVLDHVRPVVAHQHAGAAAQSGRGDLGGRPPNRGCGGG